MNQGRPFEHLEQKPTLLMCFNHHSQQSYKSLLHFWDLFERHASSTMTLWSLHCPKFSDDSTSGNCCQEEFGLCKRSFTCGDSVGGLKVNRWSKSRSSSSGVNYARSDCGNNIVFPSKTSLDCWPADMTGGDFVYH